jgi:hypothetical protein
LSTNLEIAVNLLDWIKGRNSKPGVASGERVNEAIVNHERFAHGLPPQRKAWLIDLDGTKHYHDLDVRDNSPSQEVTVRLHKVNADIEEKIYEYEKEAGGYLIYYQVS